LRIVQDFIGITVFPQLSFHTDAVAPASVTTEWALQFVPDARCAAALSGFANQAFWTLGA
jgi:hypothetical protein